MSLITERLRDQMLEIEQLTESENWSSFVQFLKRRKQYFNERLIGCVKSDDFTGAKVSHALMEEMDALVSAFKKEPKRLEGMINESK